MSRKQTVIDIDENGNCSIEGHGFEGAECEKYIKEIESAIGSTTSKHTKPEHRQRASTGNRNVQRGR